MDREWSITDGIAIVLAIGFMVLAIGRGEFWSALITLAIFGGIAVL